MSSAENSLMGKHQFSKMTSHRVSFADGTEPQSTFFRRLRMKTRQLNNRKHIEAMQDSIHSIGGVAQIMNSNLSKAVAQEAKLHRAKISVKEPEITSPNEVFSPSTRVAHRDQNSDNSPFPFNSPLSKNVNQNILTTKMTNSRMLDHSGQLVEPWKGRGPSSDARLTFSDNRSRVANIHSTK